MIKNHFSWLKLVLFGALAVSSFLTTILVAVNILFGGYDQSIGGEIGGLVNLVILALISVYTGTLFMLEFIIFALVRKLNSASDRYFRAFHGSLRATLGDDVYVLSSREPLEKGYHVDTTRDGQSRIYTVGRRNVANINEGSYLSIAEIRHLASFARFVQAYVSLRTSGSRRNLANHQVIIADGVEHIESRLGS